jgi:hypothetical protein
LRKAESSAAFMTNKQIGRFPLRKEYSWANAAGLLESHSAPRRPLFAPGFMLFWQVVADYLTPFANAALSFHHENLNGSRHAPSGRATRLGVGSEQRP